MEGSAESTVDRTRMRLPARFRAGLGGDALVVSRGLAPCLYVYAAPRYERLLASLSGWQDPRARTIRRFLLADAIEAVADSRGRFSVGRRLMDYSGIRDRIVCRWGGVCVEVWEPSRLTSFLGSGNESSAVRELLLEIEP